VAHSWVCLGTRQQALASAPVARVFHKGGGPWESGTAGAGGPGSRRGDPHRDEGPATCVSRTVSQFRPVPVSRRLSCETLRVGPHGLPMKRGARPNMRSPGKPEYVELTTRVADKKVDFHIVFRLADGKDARVTDAGLHVLVRMKDRAYDAYTGAAGLPWAEYMSRLGARAPIFEKVVESP